MKSPVYQWYFNDHMIQTNNSEYGGSTTDCLAVKECLLKHQGLYKCSIHDEDDNVTVVSQVAKLRLGMLTPTHFHPKICVLIQGWKCTKSK